MIFKKDDPVLYKLKEDDGWQRGHFAEVLDDRDYYVYHDGMTSFTGILSDSPTIKVFDIKLPVHL